MMTLAAACAPLVALPVAGVLIGLKRLLPGAPDRRYRCTLVRLVSEQSEPSGSKKNDLRASAFPEFDAAGTGWLPLTDTRHEHYVH